MNPGRCLDSEVKLLAVVTSTPRENAMVDLFFRALTIPSRGQPKSHNLHRNYKIHDNIYRRLH